MLMITFGILTNDFTSNSEGMEGGWGGNKKRGKEKIKLWSNKKRRKYM